MKWSFASVGIIILGLIGVSIILLFQQLTTNNENDYYLLKEITEAAMIDAVDIPHYRETGELKIVEEKFVENFTRRFAESTIFITNDYEIKFYDIMEIPPKVSILINTGIGEYTVGGNADEYGIANKLDAILELTGEKTNVSSTSEYYNNPYVDKTYTKTYYAMVSSKSTEFVHSLKVPSKLIVGNIKDIQISSVRYLGQVTAQDEFNIALLNRELSYNVEDSTDYMQSINDYETNVSVATLEYYNCGVTRGNYICDDVNRYYVSGDISVSYGNKNNSIFKYEVVWKYKEYEFVN